MLRAFHSLQPAAPIVVASAAPEKLFARAVPEGLTYRSLQCDVGLVQKSALEIDEAATAARVAEFTAGYGLLVEREAEWLSDTEASVVVGDVPPLAFDAAAEVGLTAVAIANFSWDWIYRHLAARQPSLLAAAEEAARSYSRAALLLELPFAGDLSAFPWRDRIPLVARSPRVPRAEARRRLGLPDGILVLVSFGGFDVALDRAGFTVPAGAQLVFSEDVAGALDAAGLAYQDLVGAVDVVVSKPGYGIVSDLAAARGRLVYTERGDFPEYPILVRDMAAYLPAVHVSNDDLLDGRIAGAVEEVLALPLPPAPDVAGAMVAAHRLAELL